MSPASRVPAWLPRLRAPLAFLTCGAGALLFVHLISERVALSRWAPWVLLGMWCWELLLTLACASAGLLLVRKVARLQVSSLEALALALPVGLVLFIVGMYAGGFLGILRPWFAVALPLALLLAGAREAREEVRRIVARPLAPYSRLDLAIGAFGMLAVGILYLGVITPDAVNYDASWNHLVIAQDYAREGRIGAFPGDWVKNVPHLGSIVNTWAFMVPGYSRPVLHWMLALHDEFTIVMWTALGVAAGVQLMAEDENLHGGWVALFLFPGLFVYDGNIGAAADHFLGVFILPLVITAFRLLQSFEWRRAVLVGALAGGALLTKLHAVYVLLPLTLVFGARFIGFAVGHVRNKSDSRLVQAALAGAVAVGIAVLLLSLHFAKNYYYFGNPFFPLAQGKFGGSPEIADAQLQMDNLFADWRWHPPAGAQKYWEALKLVFTFSFVPHYSFINDLPVFGSLFTLCLPLLLVTGRARALWLGAAVGVGALFTWACTFWVDRNLQLLLPTVAAVTGAILVRVHRLGLLARAGVVVLVAVQLAWAIPLYFSGTERIFDSIALLKSSYEGSLNSKLNNYRKPYVDLGKWLPPDALVMLHDNHIMLGIDRPVLLDWVGFQGVIDYRKFRSAADLGRRLHELGVTHVAYVPGGRAAASKQEEVIFAAFLQSYERKAKSFGGVRVFALSKAAHLSSEPLDVLALGIPNYKNGLYPVQALGVCEEMPPDLQHYPAPREPAQGGRALADQLERAGAVLLANNFQLPREAREILERRFKKGAGYSSFSAYVSR